MVGAQSGDLFQCLIEFETNNFPSDAIMRIEFWTFIPKIFNQIPC